MVMEVTAPPRVVAVAEVRAVAEAQATRAGQAEPGLVAPEMAVRRVQALNFLEKAVREG